MARVIFLTVTVIALVLLLNGFAASVDEPNKGDAVRPAVPVSEAPITIAKPKARVESVTMVDFYMRDGNTVSGKLLSDDPTQLIIEQPFESTVITKTYSKREVDTRTVRTRSMPEWQYYSRLAEYFTARTWDFVDDPDDFIEAIRCYEKAKQSLQAGGADSEKIADIDKAIKRVQDDREVWTREVESRAKLKKLEYDAEAENRLKKLESSVAESSVKLNESIKDLDKTAEDLKKDYQKTDKTIGDLNKDMVKQINNLQVQLNDDLVLINTLFVRLDACCRSK
jgi:prefoldin subunit 5